MIDKQEVLSVTLLNDTQLHAELIDKIVLLDTSMDFDGKKFETSEEIAFYLTTQK